MSLLSPHSPPPHLGVQVLLLWSIYDLYFNNIKVYVCFMYLISVVCVNVTVVILPVMCLFYFLLLIVHNSHTWNSLIIKNKWKEQTRKIKGVSQEAVNNRKWVFIPCAFWQESSNHKSGWTKLQNLWKLIQLLHTIIVSSLYFAVQ